MRKKLKPGGVVRVVQSGIAATLQLLYSGALSFRAARTVVFPPANRLRLNPFHQHFNMWGWAELAEDFERCGYTSVRSFDAGAWRLDTIDELHLGAVERYHDVMIPNLGIEAFNPMPEQAVGLPARLDSASDRSPTGLQTASTFSGHKSLLPASEKLGVEHLTQYERKLFSQNGEDGVTLRLLELFGIQTGFFFEIGVEAGVECNTRILRERPGFEGVSVDCRFEDPATRLHREFVTCENIYALCERLAIPTEIAVLSIDIDGNDYWLWKSVASRVQAEIVIIEYNAALGSISDRVTPYDPNFQWSGTDYFGASIAALAKLGANLGYSLVYADAHGVNLFFVRQSALARAEIRFAHQADPLRLFRPPRFGRTGRGHPPDTRKVPLRVDPLSIPRIIHQTWKTSDVGAPFKPEWIASWKEQNPGWEYRLWTDNDLKSFVEHDFPDFLPVYESYDLQIKRVDAARYLILKQCGGVFVDLDFICLKPSADLLAGHRMVFGKQHPGPWIDSKGHVCNAFMASVPDHPFWSGIEFELANYGGDHVLEATGPHFLTRRASNCFFFLEPQDLPTVFPSEVFYLIPWNDPVKDSVRNLSRSELCKRYPDAVALTFWTATWLPESPP